MTTRPNVDTAASARRLSTVTPLSSKMSSQVAALVATAIDRRDPELAVWAALIDKLNRLILPRRIVRDSTGRPVGVEVVEELAG